MSRRARFRGMSLRARLMAGAGVIALVCLGIAMLVVDGARETRERIDAAAAAQGRLETLGALSARINDYAIVAIESSGSPAADRLARLGSRAEVVRETFDQAGAGLAEAVEAARDLPEIEQMARATRSIGLARMRAEFDTLDRRLTAEAFDATGLRPELDSFATRFSPLLDQQIVEERRAREGAFAAVRDLAGRLVAWAAGLAAAALLALLLFNWALVRPLLGRLARFGQAASAIGGGASGVRLDDGRRDELGLVAAQINRMAARLDRRAGAVAADRRRLEETVAERTAALRAANERLGEIDRSRRRFFSDIGHELRTPLTVIRAEADLGAADAPLDPDEARASFEVIRARARRLNRRIDDLLRVARSESGEIALDRRPFDLARSAAEAAEDAAPLAERRRIEIETGAYPATPPVVSGDADWTRQVIAGLLDNAIRLSPEGARIRLDCAVDGTEASVTVTDEGPGVADDLKPRLFQRFTRGQAPESGLGFGIGLALAHWVMETQGGRIACQSPAPVALSDPPKGPGATFRLTLPREEVAP